MANEHHPVPPITLSLEVPLPIAAAFELFCDLAAWWPREYTWSGESLAFIGMDRRAGGKCYEVGPNDLRLDWAHLLAFEPYTRLAFTWNIGPNRVPVPDPAQASEVEVRFFPAGEHRTRIETAHRAFEHHGEEGAAYREALALAQGWPYMLQRYRDAAARRANLPVQADGR